MQLITVDKMYPEASKYMDLLNKIPKVCVTMERSNFFASEMRIVLSYACWDGTVVTDVILFWRDEDPVPVIIKRLSGYRFIDWRSPWGVCVATLPTFGNLNELRMKLQLMGIEV